VVYGAEIGIYNVKVTEGYPLVLPAQFYRQIGGYRRFPGAVMPGKDSDTVAGIVKRRMGK
jgi:hypothetical protein